MKSTDELRSTGEIPRSAWRAATLGMTSPWWY